MNSLAIVGPGAIGCTIAAHLWAADQCDQVLCARTPLDSLVVETPAGRLLAAPRVVTSPESVDPSPWVLLATKAHQVAGAAPWLERLCTRKTHLVVLQNGVEHAERVAPYANGARVIPVVVDCPASRVGPGRVVQRAEARLTLADDGAGTAFAGLFVNSAITVTLAEDFTTTAWRKLCVNVAGGAITAVTDQTLGVMREPGMVQLALDLVRECVVVGRAEGAQLDDTVADDIVASLKSAPPNAVTSMLSDRRAGRPLEVDARNGAVVRIGKRHGIDTPANAAVVTRLRTINS